MNKKCLGCILVVLVYAVGVSAKIYKIPDNVGKGDPSMNCEATSQDTVDQAILNLKKEMPYCQEPKETFVKGNVLVYCKHPNDSFKSKVIYFSIAKENCEALIVHAKTNIVPKGFENPKKVK